MIGALWSRVRNRLYDKGVFSIVRPKEFVISIGNLTWGGTGKTSLTSYLAKFLINEGIKVGILSRGYQRHSHGPVVVNDGHELKSTWQDAGDEPYLLATAIPQAAIVVAESRVEGLPILSRFQPDVILLDDAFQHRRIARDLNLVLVDSTENILNLHVLPFGKLREPVDSLNRATAIILTHSKNANPETEKAVSDYGAYVYHANYQVSNFEFSGKSVAAFCGIASPQHFQRLLNDNGAKVVLFREFPDHHLYSQAELEELEQEALESGAEAILTTAKDAVKIPDQFRLPLDIVRVEFVIDEKEQFESWILAELSGARASVPASE
jgi:tetraacyldisaccharide 4'-kinase